jgi:hypothetical protein
MAALLLLLWLPLAASPYPPLYDYQGHLLEARVARDFDEPGLAYADGFVLRPGWMLDSNALMTLAIVGLSQLAPLDLAGRLALGLSQAIFLFGLAGLLRRAKTAGALLPLAPLLAYNFTFSSGWLNFALATGLGLCALSSYERWVSDGRRRELGWLALLALLIYSAHLVVWGLLALILGARAATNRLSARQGLLLAGTAASTLLLTLPGRPAMVAILLVGPCAWLCAWLLGRLRLPPRRLALAALLLGAALFALGRAATPALQQLDPAFNYAPFARATFPIRTFTLAQQLPEHDQLLGAANLLLVALLAAVATLVGVAIRRDPDGGTWRRLAPVGLLVLLYGAAPSVAGAIAVVEPRLILWMGLIVLSAIRLPDSGRLRQTLTALCLAAGLLASLAYSNHALRYQHEAIGWRDTIALLGKAPRLLVLGSNLPRGAGPLLRYIESRYNGVYFSARAPIEQGGVSTRVFGNGPFYLRPDLETAQYLWRPEPGAAPLDDACAYSRERFDAALAWGPLEPALHAALDACFGPGRAAGYLTTWQHNARAGGNPGPRIAADQRLRNGR